MQEIELEVRNPSGLHARPASVFVKTAAGFRSRVQIQNLTRESKPGDAKSILTMLTAGVKQGHRVRITAEGEDEGAAIASLAELVRSGMGESVE